MKTPRLRTSPHLSYIVLALIFCSHRVHASVSGTTSSSGTPESAAPEGDRTSAPPPKTVPEPSTTPEPSGPEFVAGVDLYQGYSNVEGYHHFSDGFFAGASPGTFSGLYLRWKSSKGAQAKLSLGTGRLYTGPDRITRQPLEAWYQFADKTGKTKVTVGKFYVPFALQEWEYETKPGVLVERAFGPYSLAASANYNQNTHRANSYLRLGRSFGDNLSVGVSLGVGRGLSFDSIHDRALGFDVTAAWKGFEVRSEYMAMRRRAAERFRFGYAKVSYTQWGKLKPFVGRYDWKDTTGELGTFRSSLVGLDYQLTPQLGVEGAYALTSDQHTWWLQLHWAAEHSLLRALPLNAPAGR